MSAKWDVEFICVAGSCLPPARQSLSINVWWGAVFVIRSVGIGKGTPGVPHWSQSEVESYQQQCGTCKAMSRSRNFVLRRHSPSEGSGALELPRRAGIKITDGITPRRNATAHHIMVMNGVAYQHH